MKKYLQIGITVMAFFAWCGMMYPELSFTEEVLRVITEDGTEQEQSAVEAYYGFLQAEPGQIEVKSRLVEFVENMR
ncbi:MAG: hypothetical protein J6B10_02795 [Lachnospiraceae bacterium]|nr:hypothetical protein [Lachnospiraceae bacterium]